MPYSKLQENPERSRGDKLKKRRHSEECHFVYILRTSSDTLYIGQTNNLKRRLEEHKNHKTKSAKYIRYFSSFDLVYSETHPTRETAMKREWQLKKWPRARKETLINMTFREKVYEIVKKIPKGKVATYGQIARLAGNPKASRVVGLLMKTNPYVPSVPCHRVVASNGNLTGYSGGKGIPTKKKMLISEGVFFISNNVDLLRSQWR